MKNEITENEIEAVGQILAIPTILDVISQTTGMRFVAVAHVTNERWVACAVHDDIKFGLKPGDELKIETTLCQTVHQKNEPVIIDNVSLDAFYNTHLSPSTYGYQSYVSVPILLEDGRFFGTLCAIDPEPNQLNNAKVKGMFQMYADLIAFHINAIEKWTSTEENYNEEKRIAELRDQFIAILGHDLRNPVSAVAAAAHLLSDMQSNDSGIQLVKMIQDSTYRISGLIENILDFARGQMGGGLVVEKSLLRIEPVLLQVVDELKIASSGRVIVVDINLESMVYCDGKRIAQLFSNLLGNALTHGKKDAPVEIKASINIDTFTLSICNEGKKISALQMGHLFQPFYREKIEASKQGLGLGLFISSQIATSHGGVIDVESSESFTCFTLKMPVRQDFKAVNIAV